MTSLWQLTAPAIPSDPFAPRSPVDVIVVGAGLTGLTTAVLLARAGLRVEVLEARAVGAATTGNTTGKVSLLQGTVLGELRRHAGDEVLGAYVEANREGQAWLLRELERRGIEVPRRSAYTFLQEAGDREALEREFDASLAAGLPVEESGTPELPFDTVAALRLDGQAQVQPLVVLARLAEELRERNGRLVEGCRVRGAAIGAGGVTLDTSLGETTADTCVLATGTPVLDRGMFFARLEPSRSFVCAYRLPGPPPEGMYLSADAPDRSLREASDAQGRPLLLVGGGAHVTGRGGDTRATLAEIDAWTGERFAGAERVARWGAQDYRNHTAVPYAGRLPGGGGRIFTATGYNKWGMTNAVAAALTLAAELLGGHLEWAQTLREHHLSRFDVRDGAGANLAVAGHLIAGWAGAETRAVVDPESLDEGEGVVSREGAEPVGSARIDGRICRVSGICPHLGGVLSWNAAERSWDCPLHGSRFAAGGERLEGPALRDLETR